MVLGKKLKLYRYHLGSREGLILQSSIGWGEIAPLPGFSRETLAEALTEVHSLWPDLSHATLPSVRFGYACSQRPLRSVHLPLAALNNSRPGFQTLKLKLGHLSIPAAITLVQQYIGRYSLRLDCNRAWTLEQALTFAHHFQPTDFAYLEEPVRTFEELVHFSELTHFPLAIDEQIHANWSAIPTLKAIVVKPTIVGMIPTIPAHLDLILSSSHETGLGLIHIALLAPNALPIGLDTVRADDLLTHPIDTSNGYFSWHCTSQPINMSKIMLILDEQ